MNKKLIIPIILVILAVVGFGLYSAQDGTSSLDAGDSAKQQLDDAAEEREAVPTFNASLVSGGSFDSSEIEGPAIVHVYASWCPSCQAEAPEIAKLQNEHPDLDVYFLNVADEPGPAVEFVEESGWNTDAPIIADPDREIESKFGLVGQPHTVFVDADGKIATIQQGPGGFDTLDSLAKQVQQESV